MVDRINLRARPASARPGSEAFHTLAEAVDRCVFFKDTTERYVLINTSFSQWLGRKAEDIIGRTVFDLWPPAVAEALAADDRRVLAGECINKEEQRPNANELRTLKTVKMPVRDSSGRVSGILGSFADVTDERRRDEKYRQALRHAAVGRLAAGLHEDLNRFLALVQDNTMRHLEGECADDAQVPGRLENAIARASELTHRLIVFARADETTAESAQLNVAVTEVTKLFRSVLDRRILLEVRLGGGLPRVQAPMSQLTQIVLNLCVNGRDAMLEGGRLKLETRLVHRAFPVSACKQNGSETIRRHGDFVCLSVTDSGTCKSAETRNRLFDSWYTTKVHGKGSGLGLGVVQDVVLRYGGWVECASTGGRGTSFSVFLPVDEADTDVVPSPARNSSSTPPTLLLADNDRNIVSLCLMILEGKGYRVHTAENGLEAIDVFRREQGRIDVVLLDQNMPGMSGLKVMAELAETDPRVRVLLMSGAPLEEIPSAFDRNLRGFLNKPFKAIQLLRAVEEALNGN